MSQRDDDSVDREAILARRALFLSSALAALSCSPASPSGTSTTPTVKVTSVPTPNTGGATVPTGTSTGPDVDRQPPKVAQKPWEEVVAAAPPRTVSTKLSKGEQEELNQLNTWLDKAYASVREIWAANPGCDPAKPDCRDGWRALGEKTRIANEHAGTFSRALCGPSDTNPPTYSLRLARHRAFLGQLLADAVEHKNQIAASYSAQGEQEWRKIAANATTPPPMPCLSCAPPQVYPIGAFVSFADGSDALDTNDPKVQSALTALKDGIGRQPNTAQGKVRVRGHADPKERDVDRVALGRAKAVVAWLGKNGVDPKRLEAVGIGAEATIANGATAEGAAANRRVDIELVLPPRKTP